jgi:antitoxin VapB
MPEADIAATLVAEGQRRRCQVPVALVAADERIAKYRHPLPTVAPLLGGGGETSVRRYVMVVGCFLREGLVVSLTRFKQVEALPAELTDAYARICAVDAVMQEATRSGQSLGDVFAACQAAYPQFGFAADEWHRHHQGGATGYAGRTCKGAPGETFPVLDTHWPARAAEILGEAVPFGSAFAWNPSAPGVKSEDTFLLLPDGRQEIVSRTPGIPPVDLAPVLGRACAVEKAGIAG